MHGDQQCACLGHDLKPDDNWGLPKLIYTGLTDVFWTDMSLALWAGLFVSSPLIFYQLWKFIAPGLYKKERRIAIAFALLLGGVLRVRRAVLLLFRAAAALRLHALVQLGDGRLAAAIITQYLDLTRD